MLETGQDMRVLNKMRCELQKALMSLILQYEKDKSPSMKLCDASVCRLF